MVYSEINTDFLKSQNMQSVDFRKLLFYLNHFWIVKFFKRLHLTYVLRSEVSLVNKKLKQRLAEITVILSAVTSYKGEAGNLTKLIEIINKEIDKYSYAHNEVQKMFQYKSYRNMGDWDTTNAFLIQIIEAEYKLLRASKKVNKKTSIAATQLAKDIVSHSRSTLSKIVNSH